MRYVLTTDFEEDAEIKAFLDFVRFHSNRLKCPTKDVFVRLALEWERNKSQTEGVKSVRTTSRKTNKQV